MTQCCIVRDQPAEDVSVDEKFYGMSIENMFYQYTSKTKGWKQDKKSELADKLAHALTLMLSAGHLTGNFPFVKVDRYGNDVTISRITYLSGKEQDRLVEIADKIYSEVMK